MLEASPLCQESLPMTAKAVVSSHFEEVVMCGIEDITVVGGSRSST